MVGHSGVVVQYWTAELSALLTNRAVLAAHKDLRRGRQLAMSNDTIVWGADCAAAAGGGGTVCRYVAVFNVWCGVPRKPDPPCPPAPWGNGTHAETLSRQLLGLPAGGSLKVTDLWNSSGSFVLGAATQGLTAHTAHLDATLWKITGASEPAK